jgi:hypothetical protein
MKTRPVPAVRLNTSATPRSQSVSGPARPGERGRTGTEGEFRNEIREDRKFGHVTGVAVLYNLGRISITDAMAAGQDLLLGVLFILAFAMTRSRE